MTPLVGLLLQRWQDAAAVRAERELEPTLRRRFDRLPQRVADRHALRVERRSHRRGADDIDRAIGESWGKATNARRR